VVRFDNIFWCKKSYISILVKINIKAVTDYNMVGQHLGKSIKEYNFEQTSKLTKKVDV